MTDPLDPDPSRPRPKALLWAGRVLSALLGLAFLAGAVTDILKLDFVVAEMTKAGYPESAIRPLGWVIAACALLYLVPQTAVLGGLLLTAYMGGAVCHHVRSGDPIGMVLFPVLFGALVWVALLLRDSRLRTLLPLRKF